MVQQSTIRMHLTIQELAFDLIVFLQIYFTRAREKNSNTLYIINTVKSFTFMV